MAEETPDSLRGFFGGRAASNNEARLDSAHEKLTQRLESLSAAFENVARNVQRGWGASGGPTAGSGNGGWNGGHAPASHRADQEARWTGGGGYQGQRTNGGQPPGGGGTHAASYGMSGGMARHAGNMYAAAGGTNGIAKGAAALGVGAVALDALNHGNDRITNQSLASQAGYGTGGFKPSNYDQMFRNNYTASSSADMQQYQRQLSMTGGSIGGYMNNRRMIEATSLVDPSITNAASMQASTALGSVGSFNRMAALGINPMGPGGSMQGDPMSVARQILSRMGSSAVRTEQQVDAAFSPSGSATVTIDNYVADGYLDPSAVPAVKANMRAILKAQIKGMGYGEFRKAAQAAASTGKTPDSLKAIGVGDSVVQRLRSNEGERRNRDAETVEGFIATLALSTTAKKKMNTLVNEILGIPGVGETFGGSSGFAAGGLGTIGKLISGAMPGSKGLAALGLGDGPSSASAYATNYAVSAGAAAAKGGFGGGTGGHSARTGGAGGANSVISSGRASSSKYNLGAVKPWVAQAADLIGPKFGITSIGGVGSRPGPSDHPAGLALDFMCSRSQGDKLAPYVVANARKLNVTYVIWKQQIWSLQRSGDGWRPMEDRGSVTANHFDHVHVSFMASPVNGDFSNLSPGGGAASMSTGGAGGAGGGSANAADMSSMAGGPPGASSYSGLGYSQVGALGGSGGGSGGMMSGSMGMGTGTGTMATVGRGAGTSNTGAGGMVRNGTFNVLFSSDNKSTQDDLSKLLGKADVLGLTEFTGKKAALAKWLSKQGWGTYKGRGDSAITWNKDKYDLIKSGDWQIQNGNWPRPGSGHDQFAAYGLLRDKDTGQQFWEIAAHLISKADPTQGDYERARTPVQTESIKRLNALVKKLSAGGMPVFLTGDLNMDLDRGDWRNISGLKSNWKPGQRGMGTRGMGNHIDHILSNPALATLLGSQVVGGLNSDHNAALAQYNIAGQGQGPSSNQATGQSAQTPAGARAYAKGRISGMGWSSQFAALDKLWMRESGWRWDADNPSSSAYGIPQALPGSKMSTAGADWRTNGRTQINWGLGYIKDRYGNPNAAWGHSQNVGWYDEGAWNISKDHLAGIHKGEMILPEKVAAAVRDTLSAPTRGGRGGSQVNFHDGAIKVYLQSGSEKEARKAGSVIVDTVVNDRRMQNLLSGVSG